MIIRFNEEELGLLVNLTHKTKFSTGRVKHIMQAIYEANLEEDINSAIEHLEEVDRD